MSARFPPRAFVVPLLLAISGAAWTLTCLLRFRDPFLWIFPFWLAACVVAAVTIRRPAARAAFVNLAALLALLWAFEAFARTVVRESGRNRLSYSPRYWEKDPVLGGVPRKGNVGRAKRMFDGTVVYDATYTIGPDGLRVPPPEVDARRKKCVLFFGCSFTFGEGLNDDQAMPYRVGVRTNGKYRTRNFGFHGYGAHHMLAALESGIVERCERCLPAHAVYQALPEHAVRAAGSFSWGRHSPRYRLAADGSVRRDGFLDDADSRSPMRRRLKKQLAKSNIAAWSDLRMRFARDEDIERFVAIVEASERVIREKFPGCRFHVLLWRDSQGDERFRKTLEGLRGAGIEVHKIEDMLPDSASDPQRYVISRHDDHPNALANDLIADYVAREILAQK